MNRKDWRKMTDELLADFEQLDFEQMQKIEAMVKNSMPRESHPRPITFLIAEIKRLRKDEDLLFDAYTRMGKERDLLMDKMKDHLITQAVAKETEGKNYESE